MASDSTRSSTTPARATLPGVAASLLGAWDLLRSDPIGLLVPTLLQVLVDVLAASAVRAAWFDGLTTLAATAGAAAVARTVLGAPLRGRRLAVACRVHGIAVEPFGRWPALLGVTTVVDATSAVVGLGSLGVGVGVAAAILSEGWVSTATIVLAAAALAATTSSLAIRALFAHAPMEVVGGGRSALGALWASARTGPRATGTAFVILLVGDTLTALGALPCGALVLVGYPMADLAFVERWCAGRKR